LSEEQGHSYQEWQISTLMLAYDAARPVSRDDTETLNAREAHVRQELHELVMNALPDWYRQNPQQEFPAEVVQALTRATLRRALEIAEGE
jgi:hypothetical protein